jgi:hypothetical protein
VIQARQAGEEIREILAAKGKMEVMAKLVYLDLLAWGESLARTECLELLEYPAKRDLQENQGLLECPDTRDHKEKLVTRYNNSINRQFAVRV